MLDRTRPDASAASTHAVRADGRWRRATKALLSGRAGPDSVVRADLVLRLTGELDISTAPGVDRQLREYAQVRGDSVVIVDLAGVTFIDSCGLDSLVRAHHDLAAHDRLLSLQSVPRPAQRLFELLRHCGYSPLLEQALASMPAGADTDDTDGTDDTDDTDDPSARPGGQGTDRRLLSATVTRLHGAVHRRAALDQAKGLLMGVHGCNAAQAEALLEQIAARHMVTLDDLADCLGALATTGRGGDASATYEPAVAAAARAAWGEQRVAAPVPRQRGTQ